MPTVRKRGGNRAGRYDRKNEVQELLQLVFVDAICTCGLILIIPAVRSSRTKTKTRVMAICQNCGRSWYL